MAATEGGDAPGVRYIIQKSTARGWLKMVVPPKIAPSPQEFPVNFIDHPTQYNIRTATPGSKSEKMVVMFPYIGYMKDDELQKFVGEFSGNQLKDTHYAWHVRYPYAEVETGVCVMFLPVHVRVEDVLKTRTLKQFENMYRFRSFSH